MKSSYLIPKVLVEVLQGAAVSDVGDVDDAFEGDAVATDRLGHCQQVCTDATLNLKQTVNTISKICF